MTEISGENRGPIGERSKDDGGPDASAPAPGSAAGNAPGTPSTNGGQPTGDGPSSDERTMGLLAHLLGGLFYFIGPLIIWLVKKDESEFVNDQGKEALNFQLTMLILHVVAYVLAIVTCGFLFFLPLVTLLIGLVMGIIGGLEANKGKLYRYPFNIRMVK